MMAEPSALGLVPLQKRPEPLPCVAQLVGASSCKLKGCGFDSRSGHVPSLQVSPRSPVGVHYKRQPIDVSLPPPFPML